MNNSSYLLVFLQAFHSPEAVIFKLDVKLRTPSPKEPAFPITEIWVSQTSHNPAEAICQSTLVETRISRHQSSSPTPIFEAVKSLAKGMNGMAHKVTLIEAEASSIHAPITRFVQWTFRRLTFIIIPVEHINPHITIHCSE